MSADYTKCRHCGARIELIHFAPPEWRHWPSPHGNYTTREKYRICHGATVAEPEPEGAGS